jgi:hypothetical protein
MKYRIIEVGRENYRYGDDKKSIEGEWHRGNVPMCFHFRYDVIAQREIQMLLPAILSTGRFYICAGSCQPHSTPQKSVQLTWAFDNIRYNLVDREVRRVFETDR